MSWKLFLFKVDYVISRVVGGWPLAPHKYQEGGPRWVRDRNYTFIAASPHTIYVTRALTFAPWWIITLITLTCLAPPKPVHQKSRSAFQEYNIQKKFHNARTKFYRKSLQMLSLLLSAVCAFGLFKATISFKKLPRVIEYALNYRKSP